MMTRGPVRALRFCGQTEVSRNAVYSRLDHRRLRTFVVKGAARNGNNRQEAAALWRIGVVESAADGPTTRLDLVEEHPCDRKGRRIVDLLVRAAFDQEQGMSELVGQACLLLSRSELLSAPTH